jgi:hypothetical protein
MTTTVLTAPSATTARTLRSIGAVLGGLVATFVITTAVDIGLHATGVFPAMGTRMSDALFVLALAYRLPLNALGSYVAGRLAPARPFRHALALGGVGVVIATIGAVVMCEFGPLWYSLANIAIALPCAWVGGKLAERARGSDSAR